ncbi:hydratase [Salipiger aestuarii]|uniref:hydratase n=1 Tax=Salipiger aestuarii TaxID=568098 RepID=UPI00123BCDF2|nr:hydratase [Salipiger aestuarii]KAA8610242.1 hydratase [Salipiger aestuarii]
MGMIETVTAAFLDARQRKTRIDAATVPTPDYDAALEIQSRVQRRLGPVSGFKVGARPEGAPSMAPILSAQTWQSGARVPVRDTMGIELEIGFEVIAAPNTVPDAAADPLRCFRPRIVLELVDSRLSGAEDDALLKLADMQMNEGVILGPVLDDWDGSDFGTLDATLTCGDTVVVDGPVSAPGGSALGSLSLLCTHVGAHCGGLQVGQVVITGSISGLSYFPGGTEVAGRIDGFGPISCHLG